MKPIVPSTPTPQPSAKTDSIDSDKKGPADGDDAFAHFLKDTKDTHSRSSTQDETPPGLLAAHAHAHAHLQVDVAALTANALLATRSRAVAAPARPTPTVAAKTLKEPSTATHSELRAPSTHKMAKTDDDARHQDDDRSQAPSLVPSSSSILTADPLAAPEALASGPREVTDAAALLEDPALHVSLDLNNAVVVVDGLRIRLATHDGGAAVTVTGKQAEAVVDRQLELRQALRIEGLTLHSVETAHASTDTSNDRRGKGVVDVDETLRRSTGNNVAYEQVAVRVIA